MQKAVKKHITKVIIEESKQPAILISERIIYKNANKQFTKVYTPELWEIIKQLSGIECKIYLYIIYHLKINRKSIVLTENLFNFSKPTFYKAVKGLIMYDIINKSDKPGYYYINSDFVFNGKI